MLICSSCNVNVLSRGNFVQFDCPSCGKDTIVRCGSCKNFSNTYSCTQCSFIGP